MKSTIYNVLIRKQDVDDVLQETMFKLMRYPKTILITDIEKLEPYMRIASRNMARKKNKEFQPEYESLADHIDLELLVDSSMAPENIFFSKLENIDIFNLPLIKESYLDVLSLKYFCNMETKEIAELLEISQDNVRARLSRAIKQIRVIYAKGVVED